MASCQILVFNPFEQNTDYYSQQSKQIITGLYYTCKFKSVLLTDMKLKEVPEGKKTL